MIAAIRHSKLVLGGLLLLVGSVVLCPHATHASQTAAAHEQAEHAEHEAEHDHGHCEFDTSHSHDFRISSDQNLLAPPVVTAVIALELVLPMSTAWTTVELELPDDPLRQLGSVRLLI